MLPPNDIWSHNMNFMNVNSSMKGLVPAPLMHLRKMHLSSAWHGLHLPCFVSQYLHEEGIFASLASCIYPGAVGTVTCSCCCCSCCLHGLGRVLILESGIPSVRKAISSHARQLYNMCSSFLIAHQDDVRARLEGLRATISFNFNFRVEISLAAGPVVECHRPFWLG